MNALTQLIGAAKTVVTAAVAAATSSKTEKTKADKEYAAESAVKEITNKLGGGKDEDTKYAPSGSSAIDILNSLKAYTAKQLETYDADDNGQVSTTEYADANAVINSVGSEMTKEDQDAIYRMYTLEADMIDTNNDNVVSEGELESYNAKKDAADGSFDGQITVEGKAKAQQEILGIGSIVNDAVSSYITGKALTAEETQQLNSLRSTQTAALEAVAQKYGIDKSDSDYKSILSDIALLPNENGSVSDKNGISYPEGTTLDANGKAVIPEGWKDNGDGSYTNKESGVTINKSGIATTSNGSVVDQEGNYYPKGTTFDSSGKAILPEGCKDNGDGSYTIEVEKETDGKNYTIVSIMNKDGTISSTDVNTKEPNGIITLTNGTRLPVGTVENKDGTYTAPSGVVYNADGSVVNKDGTSYYPDIVTLETGKNLSKGTITNADGTYTTPSGTVYNADGTHTNKDGLKFAADGTRIYDDKEKETKTDSKTDSDKEKDAKTESDKAKETKTYTYTPKDGAKTYSIKSGDTLGAIIKNMYGVEYGTDEYKKIEAAVVAANKGDALKSASLIYAGKTLTLPSI